MPLRITFNTSGLLHYAWVIPYAIALAAFVLTYLRFLFRLPKKTCLMFVVVGATFVTGAIGFELLGGRQADLYGRATIAYNVFYTCEELLEMLGTAIFIYGLLDYIASQFGVLTLSMQND